MYTVPISHGEGRFIASDELLARLIENGQVATQYADFAGSAAWQVQFNPNDSVCAIEGITSPDGRVLGKMGHSERIGANVAKNIPGEKNQKIFESGVAYFRSMIKSEDRSVSLIKFPFLSIRLTFSEQLSLYF